MNRPVAARAALLSHIPALRLSPREPVVMRTIGAHAPPLQ
jgi:hypothetical protein